MGECAGRAARGRRRCHSRSLCDRRLSSVTVSCVSRTWSCALYITNPCSCRRQRPAAAPDPSTPPRRPSAPLPLPGPVLRRAPRGAGGCPAPCPPRPGPSDHVSTEKVCITTLIWQVTHVHAYSHDIDSRRRSPRSPEATRTAAAGRPRCAQPQHTRGAPPPAARAEPHPRAALRLPLRSCGISCARCARRLDCSCRQRTCTARSAAATIAAAATAAAAAATGTAAHRCCRRQSPACARSGSAVSCALERVRSSKGRVMVGGRAANPQALSKCTDTSSKPCARCEQSMPPSQPRTKNKGALLSALLERARPSATCVGSARRHPSRVGPRACGVGTVDRRSSQGTAPKPRPLSVTRRV